MWNVDNSKLNNHLNNKKHQYPGVSGAFEEANIKYQYDANKTVQPLTAKKAADNDVTR